MNPFKYERIHDRLAIAYCDSREFKSRNQCSDRNRISLIECICRSAQESFNPCPVPEIVRFISILKQSLSRHPEKTFVACVGRDNFELISHVVFLLGSFMILAEGVDDISCKQNFENILPADGCDIALIHDCWRALYRANSIGWTVLAQDIRQSDNDNSSFDLDEFTHYSKPANGSIYKVVPEKIICFPNPTKLPDGVHWMDFEEIGRAHV